MHENHFITTSDVWYRIIYTEFYRTMSREGTYNCLRIDVKQLLEKGLGYNKSNVLKRSKNVMKKENTDKHTVHSL